MQYFTLYEKMYKHWLVSQFGMDVDIHTIIQCTIFVKEFKIPEFEDLPCSNEYGMVFEKRNLPPHNQHCHIDKEVLLGIVAGKIVGVEFFYAADLTHFTLLICLNQE